MFQINLPSGVIDAPFQNISAYFKHFNCTIHPLKKGAVYYVIETEDPINFFWAGANLFIKGSSTITTSVSEKYFGK